MVGVLGLAVRRKVAWLLLLLSMGAVQAQDLFSLKLKVDEAAYQQGVPALLKQAVAIEVVKLTGHPQIDPAIMHYFTKRPMRWISRYAFRPNMQQGVKMGYWLELYFDRQRLLQALEQQQLQFWPANLRPKLLVAAVWSAYGTQQRLIKEHVQARPELDLAYVGHLFGIPLQQPRTEDDQAFAPVLSEQDVIVLNQTYQVDGVIRGYFEEHFDQKRVVSLDWELMVPDWFLRERGTFQGDTPLLAFEQMLVSVLPLLRRHAAQNMDVEIEAEIILQQPKAETVFALEKYLQAGKPLVRSAFLQAVSRQRAVFSVRYQGSAEQLQIWLAERFPQQVLEVGVLGEKPLMPQLQELQERTP